MLSVCMIVKNEEHFLDKCLSPLSGLYSELVVVDTGSTDSTKAIALKYTNKIYNFEWCNDFSAARNYAIDKASNECILMIDADEILVSDDLNTALTTIERLINNNTISNVVGHITRQSIYEQSGELTRMSEQLPRLFLKSQCHYEGIIHEQLTPNNPDIKTIHKAIPLLFEHYGYNGDSEFILAKTERNILLLEEAYKSNPEDSYILYQLGKSYYMRKDYQKACDYFDKCLYFDLNPELEYVIDLIECYGYTLLNTEQYEKALQLNGIYDDFCSSCEFVFLMGLVYMNNGMFDEAVKEFNKASNFTYSKIDGSNSYRAFYNIGVIYECSGNKNLARTYYKKCGKYAPAKQQLRKL